MQHSRQPQSAADLAPLDQAADSLFAFGEAAGTPEFKEWLAKQKQALLDLQRRLHVAAAPTPPKAETAPCRPTPVMAVAPSPSPPSAVHAPTRRSGTGALRRGGAGRSCDGPEPEPPDEPGGRSRWCRPAGCNRSPTCCCSLKKQQDRLAESLDELGQSLPSGVSADPGGRLLNDVARRPGRLPQRAGRIALASSRTTLARPTTSTAGSIARSSPAGCGPSATARTAFRAWCATWPQARQDRSASRSSARRPRSTATSSKSWRRR